ncbi:carboxylating nicotinate-nucleotide diphosphorylase [Aquibacillus kalidii]|uniref:carboxylating nicotinate-nucleotide diphosphorylase n=1 Tax=Aquibacillus kalidii TaxID=2762597 RepID=UPI0016458814|nr:carboxylating nicotinate-nucleotide diphosphorylase [Aquibacillus kalidii]
MNSIKLRSELQRFLLEDIGDQDITSSTIFPIKEQGTGHFKVKDEGVLAGTQIIEEVYQILDPFIEINLYKKDGEQVSNGDLIATVNGSVQAILTGERVVLNLLQRMSGIATLTNHAVTILNSNVTKICDTRKTTPGLRMFEKYAVTCGGGYNHRFGLYDGVMIKDNHIAFAGSITKAVDCVRSRVGHMVKIEVETESEAQVKEAVAAGADIIMLDNQSPANVEKLVKLIPDTIISEASGNINLTNLDGYRDCGVDYISLGFITHSAKALDISLDVFHKGEQ